MRYIYSAFESMGSFLCRWDQFFSNNELIELSSDNCETFFGYYDKTPFSKSDDIILGSRLKNNRSENLELGYFCLAEGNRFEHISNTVTWSWQLGSRLQWVPKTNDQKVCFNCEINQNIGSVIKDVKSGEILSEFEYPIFDISPEGSFALSLNFSRLHRMRKGYGYGNFPDKTAGQKIPTDDGIFRIDFKTGTIDLIISTEDIANFQPRSSMKDAEHYFNHISISPNERRFFFLHLWKRSNKTYSRGIIADVVGGDFFELPFPTNLSHYSWKSEAELMVHTSRHPDGVKFLLFEDGNVRYRTVGEGSLSQPGHPSFSPDGEHMIVDTYPDFTRRQKLFLCNADGSNIKNLGKYYSPASYTGSNKCDLHPRWDHSGKRVCFDSAHKGRRSMYIMNIEQFLGKTHEIS